jgi:hypothetical protein
MDACAAGGVDREMLRLRVSNHWFTAFTGWRPSHPSAWEGWPFVVAAIDAGSPVDGR